MLKPTLEAVIFDLDGVITGTASLHTKAWARAFNEFLAKHAKPGFKQFDEAEYKVHVDGIPRYKGVQAFLDYRVKIGDLPAGFTLPYMPEGFVAGTEGKVPGGSDSVVGLGNLKNDYYAQFLEAEGATVFWPAVEFILALEKASVKVVVASSSKNCALILKKVQLPDGSGRTLFDLFNSPASARVDGETVLEMTLDGRPIKGKPDPDIFESSEIAWCGF